MRLSATVFEILPLISLNLKKSRDLEHIPFGGNGGVIYHVCTSIPLYQPAHEI